MSLPPTTRSPQTRIDGLLSAIGIAPESFHQFLEWTLCEHLVMALSSVLDIDDHFFQRQDALRAFRDLLTRRTGRTWSQGDLVVLFDRVKLEKTQHFRKPIPYEEYLKLLWQVPLVCVRCGRRPPEVVLHVDHVVPASRGGSSMRSNLQFLCAEDNLRKSNRREVTDPWLDLR